MVLTPSAAPAAGATAPTSPPLPGALHLGPIVVDPPVVLAPMAGVTDQAYRAICRSFGAPLCTSQMVPASSVADGSATPDLAADEPVRSVQLAASDPAVASRAVRRLVDELGVEHIDLNFGCPVRKVTRKGGGAAVPARPALFRAVVSAVVGAAGDVPVTVKLRNGVRDHRPTAIAAGRIAEAEGVVAVALHARSADQLYSGRADRSMVARLEEALAVPVLGNGDLWTPADALAMVSETGCDGVVVGRGCLGRPWLFAQLAAAWRGHAPPPEPSGPEVAGVLGEHARLLAAAKGEERACRELRKHAGWYVADLRDDEGRVPAVPELGSLPELDRWLERVARCEVLLADARPAPRGPTRGPQRTALPQGWLDHPDDANPPVDADRGASGG